MTREQVEKLIEQLASAARAGLVDPGKCDAFLERIKEQTEHPPRVWLSEHYPEVPSVASIYFEHDEKPDGTVPMVSLAEHEATLNEITERAAFWGRSCSNLLTHLTAAQARIAEMEKALKEICRFKGQYLVSNPRWEDRQRDAYESGSENAFEQCIAIAQEALEKVESA